MLQRIKDVLNNENGGPNLEELIGLGIALVLLIAIRTIGRVIYVYYYTTPSVPTVAKEGQTDETIVIGYHAG